MRGVIPIWIGAAGKKGEKGRQSGRETGGRQIVKKKEKEI